MDNDATEPVSPPESIAAKDIRGGGITGEQATAQIERLLNSFSAHCDDAMLRVKDEFMTSRPRIGRATIGLAIVVLGITTSTGFLMISNGATASQMLMSALGEMFLFGLVLVSGIADLLWRDPTKMLLAKDDQLARIAGIQQQILALSDVRTQWESDVNWHREKSGEQRETLAQISLQLADTEAAFLSTREELSSLQSACVAAESNLASLLEREDVAQHEVERFETRVAESQATLDSISAAVTLGEEKLSEITARTTESQERNSQLHKESGELENQNQQLTQKLESFISRIEQAKAEAIALEDKVLEADLENARLAEAIGLSELRLQELQEAVTSTEGELQSLVEQNAEQQRLADTLSSSILAGEQNFAELRAKSEELDQQVLDLETNRDSVMLETSDLEAHQRELIGAIATISASLTQREGAAIAIESVLAETNQRMQTVTIELLSKEQEAESLREQVGVLNAMVEEITQKVGDESARGDALIARTARAESELQSTTMALEERQAQLDSAAAELKNHCAEIEHLETLRSNLVACLAQLEHDLVVIEPLHAETQSLLNQNAKRAIDLEADVASKTAELNSITQLLDSANEKRDGVLQDWTTLRGEVQQIAQAASVDFEAKNRCIAELNLSIERLTTELSDVSDQVESACRERDAVSRQLLDLRDQLRIMTEEVGDAIAQQRQDVSTLSEEIGGLQGEIQELAEQRESLLAPVAELEKHKQDLESQFLRLEQNVADKSERAGGLENEIQEKNDALESVMGMLGEKESALQLVSVQLCDLRGQMADMVSEVDATLASQRELANGLGKAVATLEQEIEEKQRRQNLLASEVLKLDAKRSEAEAVLLESQGLIREHTAAREALELRINEGSLELEAMQNRLGERSDECLTVTAELEDLKNQLQCIHAEITECTTERDEHLSLWTKTAAEFDEVLAGKQRQVDMLVLESERLETLQRDIELTLADSDDLLRQKSEEATTLDENLRRATAELAAVEAKLAALKTEQQGVMESFSASYQAGEEKLVELEGLVRELDVQLLEKTQYHAQIDKLLSETTAALTETESRHQTTLNELESVQSQLSDVEDGLSELKFVLADTEGDVAAEQEILGRLRAEREVETDRLEQALSELKAANGMSQQQFDQLTEEIAGKQDAILTLERNRTELEDFIQTLERDRMNGNREFEELTRRITEQQAIVGELENRAAELNESARDAENRLADADAAYSRSEEMALKLSGEIGQYEVKIVELRGQVDTLKQEQSLTEAEAESVVKELAASRAEIAQFHEKKKEYHEQLEALRQQVWEAEAIGRQWEDFIAGLNARKLSLESDTEERALNLSALDSDVLRDELALKQGELLRLQNEIEAQAKRLSGIQQAAFPPVQEIEDESAEETLGRVVGLISALDSAEIGELPVNPTNVASPATVSNATEQRLPEPSNPAEKDGDAWDNVLL